MAPSVPRPTLLSKYLDLNDIRVVDNVISNNRLFFSSADTLNDPFEMNPALVRPKKFKPVKPRPKKRVLPGTVDRIYERVWLEQLAVMRKFGVSCFSEKNDDILMWAHYANKHQGICLVFSTASKFFDGLVPVKYVPKRPAMSVLPKSNPDRVIELMSTKLNHWAYEEEWRLFRRFKNRTYKYPKSALKQVIFGSRCSDSDRNLVLKLIGDRKISTFDAQMSPYDYKMNISPSGS